MMTPEKFLGAISDELTVMWGQEDPDNPESDYVPVYSMVPLDAVILVLYGEEELERVSDRLELILSSIAAEE